MIKKLHHAAYRCENSEETRKFYEDFLGLPLVHAFEINQTKTGRKTSVLHTFYRMDDDSHLAFLKLPIKAFNFINQHDFDLHIALEVTAMLLKMFEKGKCIILRPEGYLIMDLYLQYILEIPMDTL